MFAQSRVPDAGGPGTNVGGSSLRLPSVISKLLPVRAANATTCQPMTSAAMTPIPNKNLVRLLTTHSPTHYLLSLSLSSCCRADAFETVEPTYSSGLLNRSCSFLYDIPFPFAARGLIIGGSG